MDRACFIFYGVDMSRCQAAGTFGILANVRSTFTLHKIVGRVGSLGSR